MDVVVEEIDVGIKSKKKSKNKPVIGEWNGQKMILNQSINAAVDEILNQLKTLDLVKVNIVGNPSTGKTALAETLGHLIHSRADIHFLVRKFGRDDLKKFGDTLSTLEPTNHCLIFDDVSFMSAELSGKGQKTVEKEVTEIRHLPGGKDVKVVLIFNSHYTPAVSKFLRQSDYHIYTSLGSSDYDNLLKLTSGRYSRIMNTFQGNFLSSIKRGVFGYTLGKKTNQFVYQYRKPFAPILFFNGESLRVCVYPLRKWIKDPCAICSHAVGKNEVLSVKDAETLKESMSEKYGERVPLQALRALGLLQGINVYGANVKRCMKEFELWSDSHNVGFDQLLQTFNLSESRICLRNKTDD